MQNLTLLRFFLGVLVVAVGGLMDSASAQETLETSASESIADAIKESDSSTATKQVEQLDAAQWFASLDEAIDQATEQNKPILAIVGASWCVFCKKLDQELASAEQEFGAKWILAKIDADEQVSDARELRANGLPSIRLLSKDGVVGAAQDGFMERRAFKEFLDLNYESVQHHVPQILEIDPAEFTDEQVQQLVTFIATRDGTTRRIIIDRLSKIPDRCVVTIIDLLDSKRLADQLSALQLLRQWNAPIETLDPWIPGSIDAEAIQRLRSWGREAFPDAILQL